MALKFKLTTEAFAALSEAEKTFYKQDGDVYVLDVEGAVDKSKVDEFRSNNIELQKKLDAFKGVDLEKYNQMSEQEKKLRDKKLIEAGDIETIVNERIAAIKSDYDGKLATATSEAEALRKTHNDLFTKYEIDGAAHKAFATHKISPDAQEAVMAQIRLRFSVQEGQVVAKDGDKIARGKNGNLTIDEFVAGQPEIFKVSSTGGKGRGSNVQQPAERPKTALEKIQSGLSSGQ